jgi:hypothetical protein
MALDGQRLMAAGGLLGALAASSCCCPLLVRLNLSVFQDACFQPSPDKADQTRIADSVLNKSEQPFVT